MINNVQILKVLFLAVFVMTSVCVVGQETELSVNDEKGRVNDLVIGSPKFTDKTVGLFIESVSQIEGLKYLYYCKTHNLVLLTYDPKIHPDAESVIRTITERGFPLPLFQKEGTFKEVMQMCEQKN